MIISAFKKPAFLSRSSAPSPSDQHGESIKARSCTPTNYPASWPRLQRTRARARSTFNRGCKMSSGSDGGSGQRTTEDDGEFIVISPGYTLTRTKSHVAVTLGEEFFAIKAPSLPPSPVQPPRPRTPEQIYMDDIIQELQEQIGKLTAMLEAERREQQKMRKKLSNDSEKKITEMQKAHQEETRQLQNSHASELDALRAEFSTELEDQKSTAEQKYVHLQRDYEFLEESFKSYKGSVQEEMEAHWCQKESEWLATQQIRKENAIQQQSLELSKKFEEEKHELQKAFEREISTTQGKHNQEIQRLYLRYDQERRQKNKEHMENESLRTEVAQKNAALLKVTNSLKQTQQEFTLTKEKLLEFERSFQQKVMDMDDKYRYRIQELMNENVQLRQKFIAKCEELFIEKSAAEQENAKRLQKIKETLQSQLADEKDSSAQCESQKEE